MKLNVSVILFSLFFSVTAFGQENHDLQIHINKATFQAESSKLRLEIALENTGGETIVAVIPQFNQFERHFQFSPVKYFGESIKPYSIEIFQEDKCPVSEETMVPMQDYPRMMHITQHNLVTLPAGHKSRGYIVNLNLAGYVDNFCEGIDYTVKVSYFPQYEMISDQQRKALQKHIKKYEKVIQDSNEYMTEEKLTENRGNPTGSYMHLIIKSNDLMGTITKMNITSEEVTLMKK